MYIYDLVENKFERHEIELQDLDKLECFNFDYIFPDLNENLYHIFMSEENKFCKLKLYIPDKYNSRDLPPAQNPSNFMSCFPDLKRDKSNKYLFKTQTKLGSIQALSNDMKQRFKDDEKLNKNYKNLYFFTKSISFFYFLYF